MPTIKFKFPYGVETSITEVMELYGLSCGDEEYFKLHTLGIVPYSTLRLRNVSGNQSFITEFRLVSNESFKEGTNSRVTLGDDDTVIFLLNGPIIDLKEIYANY